MSEGTEGGGTGGLPTQAGSPAAPLSLAGLHPGDERIYRGILRTGRVLRDTLTEVTGQAPAELVAPLARLAAAGLVRVRDGVVVAERPEVAIGALIDAETNRLQRASAQVNALLNVLPSLVAEHAGSEHAGSEAVSAHRVGVQAVHGGDVAGLVRSLAEESDGELLWFRPDQWRLPVTRDIDALVLELLESGRSSRVVYPAEVLREAPETIRRRADAGERVRVVSELPIRLAIFGETSALLPDRWGGNTGRRLVVREHALVHALRAWHEQVWSRAMAAPGLGGLADPAGLRRLLLHELADGAKDEQIARSLGLSLRTVRRRIADIMAELGADSRFQAGAEAARRGWL